jgi:hypothetical protein
MLTRTALSIPFLLACGLFAGCDDGGGVDERDEEAALTAPPYTAALTAAPAHVELGQRVTVTWETVAEHSPVDWIGLYKVGAADNAYLASQYVYAGGQTSGTVQFVVPLTTALDVGPFEARYFHAGGWTKLATSNAVIGYAEYALTDAPAEVELGQQVSVTWHAPLAHSSVDWVGLYKVGAADTAYLSSQYVYSGGYTSGRLTFTVPLTTARDPGPYELRYFLAGGWVKAATSASFIGHAEYTLTDVPARVELGQPVSVTWHAPRAHSTVDWVGLYKVGAADSAYLSSQYVYGGGYTSGTLTFTLPLTSALDPGPYEFRYFLAGGWVRAATSASFLGYADYTVGAQSPCVLNQILVAGWTAPLAHSPVDWIGLYRPGAPNHAYVSSAYVYGGGMRSGTTGLAASNAGPGSYELRYFFAGTGVNPGVVTAVSPSFACEAP